MLKDKSHVIYLWGHRRRRRPRGGEGGWVGVIPWGLFPRWVSLISFCLVTLSEAACRFSLCIQKRCLSDWDPQMEFTRPAEAYIQGRSAWHSVLSYSSWLLRPGQEKVGTIQQKSINILLKTQVRADPAWLMDIRREVKRSSTLHNGPRPQVMLACLWDWVLLSVPAPSSEAH